MSGNTCEKKHRKLDQRQPADVFPDQPSEATVKLCQGQVPSWNHWTENMVEQAKPSGLRKQTYQNIHAKERWHIYTQLMSRLFGTHILKAICRYIYIHISDDHYIYCKYILYVEIYLRWKPTKGRKTIRSKMISYNHIPSEESNQDAKLESLDMAAEGMS